MMDYEIVKKIKRIAVIAIASDDELMEMLVLKGGSAIEMIYKVNNRASMDLDFSMEDGLDAEGIERVRDRLEKVFGNTFDEYGHEVFDTKFYQKPKQELDEDRRKFWGGYKFEFKVCVKEKNPTTKTNETAEKLLDKKRREAIVLDKSNSTKFMIEISPFEYCATKSEVEFENLKLYVYSPVMIVVEKIRAICQQIEDYKAIVGTSYRKSRGRDFFDIYTLMEEFPIDLTTNENKECLKAVFDAKRVPMEFINLIQKDKEFHRENFETSLKDTLNSNVKLEPFDFYVDYLQEILDKIDFKNL